MNTIFGGGGREWSRLEANTAAADQPAEKRPSRTASRTTKDTKVPTRREYGKAGPLSKAIVDKDWALAQALVRASHSPPKL